ncbi:bifunctional diaminohydroxyphosphoribosylaminopyrimidine deaminase/5-amino-6-(5-phosphoribosylamino)uracil reductase RibD [Virgibacillus halophilus]|uniref:Riboflavin biosynthesis protein RibD n=1 Tax=Tigheibacillus halophilus TaxID=361280 RepID=A0ABU5C9F4_9BACI|nr:bifunctional diaminohydroxyphosphoribosylaminopyrimidine deaminase/5-amino-6-(5-phosphoribosylamino)uracil reductase RibD [Virgibacillus halophilus]
MKSSAGGYHSHFGGDHAEIDAMKNVANRDQLAAAKMYVTLEPCSHTGKTPPCCEHIVASGITEVHIAQLDPNPLVGGRGKKFLEANGVKVSVGTMASEAVALNRMYNFYHRKKRPYVTLKYAMTLDGKINRTPGERSIITGEKSMMDVQQLRSRYQAILIGAETALVDDPQLTVRTVTLPYPPIRIVIDRRGRLTNNLKLFQQGEAPTWIFTEIPQYPAHDAQTTHVKVFTNKRWTVEHVIEVLAENGVQSVLVEGGRADASRIFGSSTG